MSSKSISIRDPVHKWIKVSRLEVSLIDTPLMQRLRYISQLSMCSMVFIGGNHSRFEHSIGTMYLAGKYCHIFKGHAQYQKIKKIVRIAALLHDIGHGPFSHSFDSAINAHTQSYNKDSGHDNRRINIIQDGMFKKILKTEDITPEDIISVWNQSSTGPLGCYISAMSAIIQGPLGADRMDFILRDSNRTGTEHLGTISHERIITECDLIYNIDIGSYHLNYNKKLLNDIIRALDCRMLMYDSVYYHKTSVAVGILIEKFINLSWDILNLNERVNNLSKFATLTDAIIFEGLNYPELQELSDRIIFRKLPKMISEKKVMEDSGDYTTRKISGIDCDHFDYYNITISRMSIKCALDNISYNYQKPYYICRKYDNC